MEGLEDANGAETLVHETLGGEVGFAQPRSTNDALGLRSHRASDGGGGGTFVPPAVLLPDQFMTGQSLGSSGNVVVGGGGGGRFMIPYSSTTTVIGSATITVPAGTFDLVVVEFTLTLNGMPTTDRLHLADGVGVVRGEANIETPGGVTERVTVPEPGTAQAVRVGGLLLAGVGRKIRRRAPTGSPRGSHRVF